MVARIDDSRSCYEEFQLVARPFLPSTSSPDQTTGSEFEAHSFCHHFLKTASFAIIFHIFWQTPTIMEDLY